MQTRETVYRGTPFVTHLRSALEKDLPSGKGAGCIKYKTSVKAEKQSKGLLYTSCTSGQSLYVILSILRAGEGGTATSMFLQTWRMNTCEFKFWLACCYIVMVFSFIYSLRLCFCFSHQDDSSGSLASISALSLLNTGV